MAQTEAGNPLTTHPRHPGVSYGDDLDEYASDWDAAIEDTTWAIEQGYMDSHLAAIVQACIERRRHLADAGAVPALKPPSRIPSGAAAFTAPAKPADVPIPLTVAARLANDAGSLRHAGHGMAITPNGDVRVPGHLLVGKTVRLRNVQNLTGVAVEVIDTLRTRVKVKLLEQPRSRKFAEAFVNGTPILVPSAALTDLAVH